MKNELKTDQYSLKKRASVWRQTWMLHTLLFHRQLTWYGRNMTWRTIIRIPNLLHKNIQTLPKITDIKDANHTEVEHERWNKIP